LTNGRTWPHLTALNSALNLPSTFPGSQTGSGTRSALRGFRLEGVQMKLNDRTVTATKPELPPGKTDAIFFDDAISGFGFRVRQGGSRVFIFQYSRNGQTKRMTLGPWPKISAAKAKEMVEALAAKVALGLDPASEKEQSLAHKETLGETV